MALAGVDKGKPVVHPAFCSVMLHTPSWGPFPGFSPRTELLTSSAFFTFTKILPKNCRNSLEQHDFTALESAIRQVQECPDKDAADILWRKILEGPPLEKLSRTTLESHPPYIVLTVGVLHGR